MRSPSFVRFLHKVGLTHLSNDEIDEYEKRFFAWKNFEKEHIQRMDTKERRNLYWRSQILLTRILLLIWAFSSFGVGIVFRPVLSDLGIRIGGVDIGFYFAQQGSILVFIVIVFIYAARMNVLDRYYDVDE